MFGDVNSSNHRSLQALACVVRDNIGRPIPVVVSRPSAPNPVLSLSLTPGQWSGRGVVGCVFGPV
jgi:hypothetical protein